MANSDEALQSLLDEAITVKNKIKRIEKEVLEDLKDSLKQLSEKLLRDMEADNKLVLSNKEGEVIIVARKGSLKLDTASLMSDLGITDKVIKKYQSTGKSSKFLKFNIN